MKALISTSLILLFITSCGSSSSKKSYTVTDDNNGTKSPRVKEIITKTADNNKSEERITRYTYNDENLLVSKKSYISKDYFDRDTIYTYNKNKQVDTVTYNTGHTITSSQNKFIYGDILYEKTKLPVVDTISHLGYMDFCEYKHTYILNASNLATSIDKIIETCKSANGPSVNPNYQSNYPTDEDKIYSADLSKHTEQYTYFSQFATATYNKGLREKVEYYSPDETNASKEPELERTSTYIYEEKPYFYKESSSPMVNLPH